MHNYTGKHNGIVYFDYVLQKEMSVDNNLLFILGYSRALSQARESDKIFIPRYFTDSDGKVILYANTKVKDSIHTHLARHFKITSVEQGYYVEIHGLNLLLSAVGCSNTYVADGVLQHVPLITKNGSDYRRIQDILEQEEFRARVDTPYGGAEEKYTIANSAIEPYMSFGSRCFMTKILYRNEEKPSSYSSYYVWNSLAFEPIYHYSLGVLYALLEQGYGTLPFYSRPSKFVNSAIDSNFYDEAHFWFQNAAHDPDNRNLFFNPSVELCAYDTFPLGGIGVDTTVPRDTVFLESSVYSGMTGVARLPEDFYTIDTDFNVVWNTESVLYYELYGTPYNSIHDVLETISIWNIITTSHTTIYYSSIRDKYLLDGIWFTIEELRDVDYVTEEPHILYLSMNNGGTGYIDSNIYNFDMGRDPILHKSSYIPMFLTKTLVENNVIDYTNTVLSASYLQYMRYYKDIVYNKQGLGSEISCTGVIQQVYPEPITYMQQPMGTTIVKDT